MRQQKETRFFGIKDYCTTKQNNTLKALEILFTLSHTAKGDNIAKVWLGQGIFLWQMAVEADRLQIMDAIKQWDK